MNGISLVLSKSCRPLYSYGTRNKISFGTSNKIDLIPYRLPNMHLQTISPLIATTCVLKHRVYADKVDATSSRSEAPKVSGAVKPYVLLGTGIIGMALGILKLEACCIIFLGVASIFVAPDFLGKIMYGLTFLHEKPFSNGDIIQVGRLKGQVLETGLMNTTLLTAENRVKVVQTSWFIGQVIENKSSGITIVPNSLLSDQSHLYASKVDATSSSSEAPKVSDAVKPYVVLIIGMAFGKLKPNIGYYIFPAIVGIPVFSGYFRKIMYGLSVLHDKPFSIGDEIEVGYLKGQVMEMGAVTTSVLTAENRRIEVPTSWFHGQVITNITRRVIFVPEDHRDFDYYYP